MYLIQGLAQNMSHWDKVLTHLPQDVPVTAIDMLTLGFEGDQFSWARAAQELDSHIGEADAVICGLSSGAVIAAKHAGTYTSGRDHHYVLAAPQMNPRGWPSRMLLRRRRLIHRYIEFRTGRKLEPKKVASILEAYLTLDLRGDLTKITSPVLVLVGRKDRVHYRPTVDIAQLVPHSERVKLQRGTHESNRSAPRQIAEQLSRSARST
ncbi:alpha/beta fold hydrolase [Nesterenkonia sp. Act20]|uniref:alpha/beta fold hydrolase n=1 Tax=Nesterenkonia sp. Act20 TaxID=1483432 RepID=UPI00350E47A2